MADKAREAFRTISEVANWLDIPAHVLRFWESKFPQIKPVKRAGGRRYYRPADMRLIGGIKKLLHDDGLTIRGVQKMLKEDGVKAISELSPPLIMPSEEEGAARRQARRARRQERQAAKTTASPSAKQGNIETEPQSAETDDVEEAPFTHVEDAPTGGDNVVSLSGGMPEAVNTTEEPVVEPADTEEVAADPLANEMAPDLEPEPEPETTPISTIPEPQDPVTAEQAEPEQQNTIAAELEPNEAEQPDIPPDPAPDSIALTQAQDATAACLTLLRRRSLDRPVSSQDAELRRAATDRLADLRARMVSTLS